MAKNQKLAKSDSGTVAEEISESLCYDIDRGESWVDMILSPVVTDHNPPETSSFSVTSAGLMYTISVMAVGPNTPDVQAMLAEDMGWEDDDDDDDFDEEDPFGNAAKRAPRPSVQVGTSSFSDLLAFVNEDDDDDDDL